MMPDRELTNVTVVFDNEAEGVDGGSGLGGPAGLS